MELLCFCACGILSGAMGRVFKARNAVSGGYTQTANVYILGVGESSTGKSASIRALFSNLERKVLREISQYENELGKFKKSKANSAKETFNESESFSFDDETTDTPKLPRNPDFIVKNKGDGSKRRRNFFGMRGSPRQHLYCGGQLSQARRRHRNAKQRLVRRAYKAQPNCKRNLQRSQSMHFIALDGSKRCNRQHSRKE